MADGVEVGFAREASAQSADGVFDTALLPWGSDIAEEGLDAEAVVKAVMFGELGAVVEADGPAQILGDMAQSACDPACGQLGSAVGWLVEDGVACVALVQDEDIVPISGEQHIVGFPMARLCAIPGFEGAFADRPALFDEAGRASALAAIAAAPCLAAGQKAVPVVLLGRAMIDVSID
ncbi:hypothetical protein TS85_14375 [Sphingomonas hengshuiensis]|uniref:Uncharacterized protein n=1 Tax=Sphingomonas hengshuiensis TaxID=1609977 RepID=A0A7U4LG15_9SPHN|nr:hypothetical protein TS85_14375 [Sphingomonas hengshuiensis]